MGVPSWRLEVVKAKLGGARSRLDVVGSASACCCPVSGSGGVLRALVEADGRATPPEARGASDASAASAASRARVAAQMLRFCFIAALLSLHSVVAFSSLRGGRSCKLLIHASNRYCLQRASRSMLKQVLEKRPRMQTRV